MQSTLSIRVLSVALAICAFGCKHGSDMMPLDIGHTWDYEVRAWPDAGVTTVKVSRALSVASAPGVELTSDRGTTRLAWVGDGLFAERLTGTQFAPALPLLFSTEETNERPWKGRVTFVDRSSPATATQSQKGDDNESFAGKKIHCILSTVHIQTAARKVELLTWFSAGIGIVRQEQRTDDKLVLSLKLLKLQGQ